MSKEYLYNRIYETGINPETLETFTDILGTDTAILSNILYALTGEESEDY